MKIRTYFSLLLAVFLCFLIFIPNAFATPMAGDTIVLSRTGTVGGATTGGGEFLATVSRGGGVIDIFKTFCVETLEHISLGDPYTVDAISESSSKTGVALNPFTAYLYTHYRAGTLDEETGGVYKYNDDVSADYLQEAIWNFQTKRTYANYLVTLAEISNWTNVGNVRVMNIVDGTTPKQDQLTLVPEPATIMLSGLGLLFVGVFFRRKFIK